MPTYSVNAYDLADFSGFVSDNPGETTPTDSIGTSLTYNGGGTTQPVEIDDDDLIFHDAYLETGGEQTLASDLVLASGTLPAGSSVELEYSLVTDDTPPITFYIIRVGPGGSNSGENVMIATDQPLTPGQTYTFSEGSDGSSTPYSTICFARGTEIATTKGPVNVEDLEVGDHVLNAEKKKVRVNWIGRRKLSPAELALHPELRPVVIKEDTFGLNKPYRDLVISQQHRIFMSHPAAQLYYGTDKFLVSAKALINDQTILLADCDQGVEYFHIMCERHEILISNGLHTESFFPGQAALNAMDAKVQEEFYRLFPDFAKGGSKLRNTRFTCLKQSEYRLIASN